MVKKIINEELNISGRWDRDPELKEITVEYLIDFNVTHELDEEDINDLREAVTDLLDDNSESIREYASIPYFRVGNASVLDQDEDSISLNLDVTFTAYDDDEHLTEVISFLTERMDTILRDDLDFPIEFINIDEEDRNVRSITPNVRKRAYGKNMNNYNEVYFDVTSED